MPFLLFLYSSPEEILLSEKVFNELPILIIFIIFMIWILRYHREERQERDKEWRQWFTLMTEDFKTFNDKTRQDFVEAINMHDVKIDKAIQRIWNRLSERNRDDF